MMVELGRGTFIGAIMGTFGAVMVALSPSFDGFGVVRGDDVDSPPSTNTAVAKQLKTLNGDFPFKVPGSVDRWRERADRLRVRVAVASGLFPMPDRPSIDARVHRVVRRPAAADWPGVEIEMVAFESLPGHHVTGMVFRPDDDRDRLPAVLSPHGHGGRLQRHSDDAMKAQLASGGERYPDSGRMPKIARCVQLARMGCVVFLFDMPGYGDAQQLSYSLAHRHGVDVDDRTTLPIAAGRTPDRFFTTPAESRLQSVFGLQTFNALRSLDYLLSRDDVDPHRVAVTGGSGGGTQAIMLGTLDDRIDVTFPNGMVSTSMQGGCVCENASLLRVGTGNVELAALFAPKPMGMTAANDWTVDMMNDGYPQLQRLYTMLGRRGNVTCEPLLSFPHNYNYVTRRVMYHWFNRHFRLGHQEPIVEADFAMLSDDEGAVWDAAHPPPSRRGVAEEAAVLGWWDQQSTRKLAEALGEHADRVAFNRDVAPAIRCIYTTDDAAFELPTSMPTVQMNGDDDGIDRSTPMRLIEDDSERLIEDDSERLIDVHVVASRSLVADLNERLGPSDDKRVFVWLRDTAADDGAQVQAMVPSRGLKSAAYTFGYNPAASVQNVGGLVAVLQRLNPTGHAKLRLFGHRGTLTTTLPAAAFAGDLVTVAHLTSDQFRFAGLRRVDDVDFVPGMVRYGDVDALAAMRCPRGLVLYGDNPMDFPTATALYGGTHAATNFSVVRDDLLPNPRTIKAPGFVPDPR